MFLSGLPGRRELGREILCRFFLSGFLAGAVGLLDISAVQVCILVFSRFPVHVFFRVAFFCFSNLFHLFFRHRPVNPPCQPVQEDVERQGAV